jgi:ubiquitin-protein ligase
VEPSKIRITPLTARQKLRLARLRGDLAEMQNIRCPIINWDASGDAPDRYLVRYSLASFIAPGQQRKEHLVSFSLPEAYPFAPPAVRITSTPPVYHPNVFVDGRICLGATWHQEEGLAFLVIRVARMLLYHKDVTNAGHPANAAAAAWYNRESANLPLGGKIAFPDPITRVSGERRPMTITRKWKTP